MMDNVPMSAEGWLRKRQAEQRRSVERDEKSRIRTLLARTDRIGKNATRVAIALLNSGRSYEEIYESARRASPDVSDSVHRRNVMRGNQAFMERENSPRSKRIGFVSRVWPPSENGPPFTRNRKLMLPNFKT